jgi:hypothetical protein
MNDKRPKRQLNRQILSEEQVAGQLYQKITLILAGQPGSAALSALGYALLYCAKSTGLTFEQVQEALKVIWESDPG